MIEEFGPEELPSDEASVECPHGVKILIGAHWSDDPMIPTGEHLGCLDAFLEQERELYDEVMTDLMRDLGRY